MSIAQLAFPIQRRDRLAVTDSVKLQVEPQRRLRNCSMPSMANPSLKHLFWELLSYDRVRDPLPLSILPPSAIKFMTSLEVFAATEVFTIVIAVVQYIPNDGSLEQMIWAVKRNIANCVVLLNEASTWSIIYPDEILEAASANPSAARAKGSSGRDRASSPRSECCRRCLRRRIYGI
jgi:hypothetical protein